jgi:hypothetical protein
LLLEPGASATGEVLRSLTLPAREEIPPAALRRAMMDSFEKLFTQASDSDLCSTLFTRIIQHYGERVDPSVLPKEDRVILLTWHAKGVIGNGGFNYLFEGDYGKDPYFAWTAEAFQAIGCSAASEAFQNVLSFFPGR